MINVCINFAIDNDEVVKSEAKVSSKVHFA